MLFIQSAAALTLETGKGQYDLNETIQISGQCGEGETIRVAIYNIERKIFSDSVECFAFSYAVQYPPSYLDPTGLWRIVAADSNTLTEEIRIKPTRESRFFTITFLSPAAAEHFRAEDINVTIRVDDAGIPVEDASAIVWLPDNTRANMENRGSGIYAAQFELPYDFNLGSWELLAAAQSLREAAIYAGSASIDLDVKQAQIGIKIIEPGAERVDAGAPTTLLVEAAYAGGKPLRAPSIKATIAGSEWQLNKVAENQFAASILVNELGAQQLVVSASDSAGNSASIERQIIVAASFFSLLNAALPYIAIALIVIFALVFARRRAAEKGVVEKLQQEKSMLEKEIEKLQHEYFEKKSVPRESYRRSIVSIRAKINEIDKRLKTMK